MKKLNAETDLLEIIKKLRVHDFASEITLKPSQRDMVNFFDEYKLKTEKEKKRDKKKIKAAGFDEEYKGQAAKEYVNVADGVKTGHKTKRILRSVNRINREPDKIDAIVVGRITNQRVKRKKSKQGVNMVSFINAVQTIGKKHNAASNSQIVGLVKPASRTKKPVVLDVPEVIEEQDSSEETSSSSDDQE